jgi:hypothetical protein
LLVDESGDNGVLQDHSPYARDAFPERHNAPAALLEERERERGGENGACLIRGRNLSLTLWTTRLLR